jgi:MFS family permease
VPSAVGPLLGGFVTTYLSWRVGFLLEVVIIAVVLSQIGLVKDVAYTGDRRVDLVGLRSPWWAWAAWCWGSWCGRRAASSSAR